MCIAIACNHFDKVAVIFSLLVHGRSTHSCIFSLIESCVMLLQHTLSLITIQNVFKELLHDLALNEKLLYTQDSMKSDQWRVNLIFVKH